MKEENSFLQSNLNIFKNAITHEIEEQYKYLHNGVRFHNAFIDFFNFVLDNAVDQDIISDYYELHPLENSIIKSTDRESFNKHIKEIGDKNRNEAKDLFPNLSTTMTSNTDLFNLDILAHMCRNGWFSDAARKQLIQTLAPVVYDNCQRMQRDIENPESLTLPYTDRFKEIAGIEKDNFELAESLLFEYGLITKEQIKSHSQYEKTVTINIPKKSGADIILENYEFNMGKYGRPVEIPEEDKADIKALGEFTLRFLEGKESKEDRAFLNLK